MLEELNALIESRTYEPGEVIIHKGDTSRDLLFLTEGLVEISTKKEDGNLILNHVEPPYILGDIAFLSGFPRTATARAKTRVKVFVLRFEKLKSLFKEFPEWVHPFLTSFASGIKSLHYRIAELKRDMREFPEKKSE
jgi:CRP-like cAMP-binding protein